MKEDGLAAPAEPREHDGVGLLPLKQPQGEEEEGGEGEDGDGGVELGGGDLVDVLEAGVEQFPELAGPVLELHLPSLHPFFHFPSLFSL